MERTSRVLVVDGHEATRHALAHVFRLFGHEVETAGGMAEGLEVAGRLGRFMLVVSALELPDGLGADLLVRLRERYEGAGGPRGIALGDDQDERWVEEARRGGFDGFLVKPFRVDVLLAMVRRVTATGGTGELGGGAVSDGERSSGTRGRFMPGLVLWLGVLLGSGLAGALHALLPA